MRPIEANQTPVFEADLVPGLSKAVVLLNKCLGNVLAVHFSGNSILVSKWEIFLKKDCTWERNHSLQFSWTYLDLTA